MILHQMDVVTAFLNGTLEEDILMQQPHGYVKEGSEHLVYKLKKLLCGLKQSPKSFYRFYEVMKSSGFKQGIADPCIHI